MNELCVPLDACAFLYYKLELAFVSSHEFSNSLLEFNTRENYNSPTFSSQ
jgi:hypothetical protein